VDLAVGYLPQLPEKIRRARLFEEHYVCLTRPDHPLGRKGPLTLKEFLAARHVLIASMGSGHQVLERTLAERGMHDNVALRLPHFIVVPLVIANTWLPAARFPQFLKQDLSQRSIYELMEATGSRPTDAVQTIEAITLPAEEAALLTVPPGSAALLVRRVGYANGVPVEYAIDHYRADRTTFRVRLGLLEQRLSDQIRHEHISF
jgi:DNA-binding transcriptional LysR family regulator